MTERQTNDICAEMRNYKKERTTQTCKTPGKTHSTKDMSIQQERKDDRKKEGQKYIDNLIFHDGRAKNLGLFLDFPGRELGPGIFPEFSG